MISEWCPTCPRAEQVWRQVAQERAFEFAVVDVGQPEGRELAARLHLRSVPSVVVDGVLKAVGVQSAEEARALVAAAPVRSPAAGKTIGITPAAGETAVPSRWQILTAAPHRVMFLAGMAQMVLTLVWWMADLLGRYAGLYSPIVWRLPPAWGHAFLMEYALFVFFMFGFLMTAMANWTGVAVRRFEYLGAALLMLSGVALFYAGTAMGTGWLLAAVALLLAGWLTGVAALARMVVLNRGRDKSALTITVLMFVGALGVAAFGRWLISGEALFAELARRGGIWLFMLPVFLTVSHRLIPFFSSRVLADYIVFRPQWSLPFLIGACAAHLALEMAGAYAWLWPFDLAMALWVAYLAFRWGLKGSFRVRLLTMLHLSLVVLSAALGLYAVQSFALGAGYPGLLGLAPLHLLAIGYFSAMTLGMVSRVSLGHSGRSLQADTLTWRCFLGVLAAAALRVTAEVPGLPGLARLYLSVLAGAVWLAFMVPWAASYVPLYLRPRADGRPG